MKALKALLERDSLLALAESSEQYGDFKRCTTGYRDWGCREGNVHRGLRCNSTRFQCVSLNQVHVHLRANVRKSHLIVISAPDAENLKIA